MCANETDSDVAQLANFIFSPSLFFPHLGWIGYGRKEEV